MLGGFERGLVEELAEGGHDVPGFVADRCHPEPPADVGTIRAAVALHDFVLIASSGEDLAEQHHVEVLVRGVGDLLERLAEELGTGVPEHVQERVVHEGDAAVGIGGLRRNGTVLEELDREVRRATQSFAPRRSSVTSSTKPWMWIGPPRSERAANTGEVHRPTRPTWEMDLTIEREGRPCRHRRSQRVEQAVAVGRAQPLVHFFWVDLARGSQAEDALRTAAST